MLEEKFKKISFYLFKLVVYVYTSTECIISEEHMYF